MTIAEMQSRAYDNSEKHGFHDNLDIPTKLMLIVSECSEALEDYRSRFPNTILESGKPVGISSELADIVIRVGDLAGILNMDLQSAVVQKMNYNEGRPHKHGGKVC